MNVKVVAIPFVFITSLLACVLSYKFNASEQRCTIVLRLFSAGVILSLALVHVISDSITSLSEIVDYPIGGVCALAGLTSLLIVEHLSHSWTNSDAWCNQRVDVEHNHTCITNVNSLDRIPHGKKRSLLMACIFEFACIFHSVFIGLSMGLLSEDAEARKMFIAILFHQVLEAISLGSILSECDVSTLKAGLFMFTYSATTPIGILIGMLIEHSYGEENETKVLITDCFQAFSGGLLLYVALFQIIAEEFSKKEVHKRENIVLKVSLYIALIVGATFMCAIAIVL